MKRRVEPPRYFVPKQRRGFLLASETVKIVIALIAIVFLVGMLSSIYLNKIKATKDEEARAAVKGTSGLSLKSIVEFAKNSKESQTWRVFNPEGWYVFGFSASNGGPLSCLGKSCICICNNVVDILDRQRKYCDATNACLIISDLEIVSKGFEEEIKDPDDDLNEFLVENVGGKIKISRK